MRRININAILSERQLVAAASHLPDMTEGRAKKLIGAIFETIVNTSAVGIEGLTEKQRDVYYTIKAFQKVEDRSPTQVELANSLGIDRRSVRQRLDQLVKAGVIVVPAGQRKITIV